MAALLHRAGRHNANIAKELIHGLAIWISLRTQEACQKMLEGWVGLYRHSRPADGGQGGKRQQEGLDGLGSVPRLLMEPSSPLRSPQPAVSLSDGEPERNNGSHRIKFQYTSHSTSIHIRLKIIGLHISLTLSTVSPRSLFNPRLV